jgi:nitroreductase
VELFEAIEKRRSTRSYKEEQIGDEDLISILTAGIQAPSAGNVQPWEFVVTKNKGVKEALAEAALGQSFIGEASVVVTVCAKEDDSARRYGERGRKLYSIQDTAAAVENMLLASTALGYGTCWIGAFDERAVKKVLNIPDGIRPVAMVPIGRPRAPQPPMSRKPLEEVVHRELYEGVA